MRILYALLLGLGATVFGPAQAAETLDFRGVIVAVSGSIAEVDRDASDAPLYVRAPNTLSESTIGKTVSGTCVILGDLCTATVFNIAE